MGSLMDYKDLVIQTVFWFLGFLFLFRIPRCKGTSGENKTKPSVSVIIPARNEEKSLPGLLASLRDQGYQPAEIIVAVSPSEDKTLEIAGNHNVRVLKLEATPEGWIGKSWACYQSALLAKGDILVFLDADTSLEKDGLQKVMDESLEKPGVISVQPYHTTKKLYEQLSAFFNIIEMGAMGTFTVFGDSIKPLGLFGPCIVIKREDYLKSGGHGIVRNEIAEDLTLGHSLKKQNTPLYCRGGRGAISFRMYAGGIRDLIDGWSKSFAAGAVRTYIPILIAIIVWIGGGISAAFYAFAAISSLNTPSTLIWPAAYFGYIIQIHWMLFRLGTFKWYTALFYPIPLLFFLVIFLYSIFLVFIKRTVRWNGATINLKNKNYKR
jgi:4,4'-diaponeurosporenoate glycosyltransferase